MDMMTGIKAKMAERDALMQRLERSFALQQLWPDVFDHGSCTSVPTGKFDPLADLRLKVTRGDGSSREFELVEVPDLIRRQLLDQVESGLHMMQVHRFRSQRKAKGW